MRIYCLPALALSVFLPVQAAFAQSVETAHLPVDMQQVEEAWARGDFAFVRQGLESLAQDSGSSLAQYRYGRVLLEGRGGPVDLGEAVVWLERAVAQNNAEAAALLAQVYLTNLDQDAGASLARSPEKALDLLTLSATLGFAEGQYQLAQLYATGGAGPQDDVAAFRWLLAASRQQHVPAQFALARAYADGLGTPRSAADTVLWLTAAANNGHLQAQMLLARAYEMGNGVAQSDEQALALYRTAAEGGLPIAQTTLGVRLLSKGEDDPTTREVALKWLEEAASKGEPDAMVALGRAFAGSHGVVKDEAKSAQWYAKAAQYDHGQAKVAYAYLLETGTGVTKDFDAAIALYQAALTAPGGEEAAIRLGQLASGGALDGRFAPQRMTPWAVAAMRAGSFDAEEWLIANAEAGLRDAQSGLAFLYLEKPETAALSVHWLLLAAQSGDAQAQAQLGQMYITGDMVPLDYVLAHKWLNVAATLGVREAEALRNTVTSLMTPAQIAEAQEGARHWIENEQPQPPQTDQTVREVFDPNSPDTVRE